MLKEKLADKLEFSAYRQTLIFDGRILQNTAILADLGVVDDSILNVCIKTPNPLNVDADIASSRGPSLKRRMAKAHDIFASSCTLN